jgi:hypothetical protein
MCEMFKNLPYVTVFLDDLLIALEDTESHKEHLKTVLEIFKKNNISVNFEKSFFGKKEVKYLGKIIDANGINPNLEACVKIETLTEPNNKRQLMKVLETINWFRNHIPNVSQKLSKITYKLGDVSFTWKSEDTEAIKETIGII